MTDTFQPGDHVTFEIDEYQADKFNLNTAIATWIRNGIFPKWTKAKP